MIETASSATAAPSVPAAFDRARRAVEPSLRRLVDDMAPEVRLVAGYHLGFLDALGHPSGHGTGKAVRPALALLSAEASLGRGGDAVRTALPGALAVELIHDFSLLHDDVMDGDLERRHRPAAWSVFGVGSAIIAGDALQTLAHQILLDVPGPRGVQAGTALAAATSRMIVGQAQDLAFERRRDVSYEECLAMSENKTGALLGYASSVGALLGGGDESLVRGLEGFGLQLGLAFQAVDDLLGLWGSPELTGKPAGNDLRRGKKTLPIVAALDAGTPEAERLAQLLADGDVADDAVEPALGLIEAAGGRARATREADERMGLALDALAGSGAHENAVAELREVASFVTRRDF